MTKRYPFKFLNAYTQDDKDIFFGREAEVAALYEMVFQTNLIVVHGASGTGKTSLIKCGLASRFQSHDWLDLEVRRGQDINRSLAKVLKDHSGEQALSDEELFSPPSDEAEPGAPLSELERLFKAVYLHTFRPIYLIFDQFEELYVLGDRAEQDAFVQTVQEILAVEQPVKMIFSIREEYLGHLFEFEKKVPQLLRKKLRVEPMHLDRVRQVIAGATGWSGSNVRLRKGEENELAQRIFEKIKGKANRLTVELPYLQVFLDRLYTAVTNDPTRTAAAEFSLEALALMGDFDDVLKAFLEEQIAALSEKSGAGPDKISPELLWDLLSALVTLEGTKEPMTMLQLTRRFKELPSERLEQCVEALEQSRILKTGDGNLELAHDALAAIIDQHRSAEQRQILETRRWIQTGYSVHRQSDGQYHFKREELARILPVVAQFSDKMDLEPHWVAFLRDCETTAAQEERKQLEAAEQRAKEAEARAQAEATLRTQAESARKRAGWLARVAAAVALVALAGLGLAALQYFQAEAAKATAENSEKAAKEQARIAVKSDSLMRLARDTAEQKAIETLLANTNTEKALAELKITSDQAVTILLEELDQNILRLEYDLTFKKCETALNLNAQRPAVAKRILEIAYFYTEADTLVAAIQMLNLLKPTGLNKKTPGAQAKLRRLIKAASPPDWYAVLEGRYFPKMIRVEGGSFLRKNPYSEKKDSVWVKVSTFQIAETETTVWQYFLFQKATHCRVPTTPSWQWWGDNPIIDVSWYDAAFYANWVSTRFQRKPVYAKIEKDYFKVDSIDYTANGHRLPTEAEWEFAARGGNQSKGFEYSGDSILTNVGWFYGNSNSRTQAVRQKKANELGLYDMSGNVEEWCNDWFGGYDPKATENPRGPDKGSARVLCGGSWLNYVEGCRVANGPGLSPGARRDGPGFRLVFVP